MTDRSSTPSWPLTGSVVVNGVEAFASNFGAQPLDVIAQGDSDPFPGTVWAVTYGANNLTVFEPADFLTCNLGYVTTADEDGDGYANADEIDNGTNECLTSDRPEDFDGTLYRQLQGLQPQRPGRRR